MSDNRVRFIDPSRLLDLLPRCSSLWMAWLPVKAWPLIWSSLSAEKLDFVAVHVRGYDAHDVFVIASCKLSFCRKAERVQPQKALHEARMWLRLRRPDEVETSAAWSVPLAPEPEQELANVS